MPNWCETDLYIRGKNVAQVLATIAGKDGGKETAFDFNKVIPMPPELSVVSGGETDLALLCFKGGGVGKFADYPWVKQKGFSTPEQICTFWKKDFNAMVRLGAQIQDNLTKYKAATWYEWCIREWGTKWNASDAVAKINKNGSAKISFQTAWAPPVPVLTALSHMFPENTFTAKYYEQGMQFQGVLELKNGEVVKDEEKKYTGHRGG